MPSGPSHWHEFWEDDQKPSEYLTKRGFKFTRAGMIVHSQPDFEPDVLDQAAIQYLCFEWDYGYQNRDT